MRSFFVGLCAMACLFLLAEEASAQRFTIGSFGRNGGVSISFGRGGTYVSGGYYPNVGSRYGYNNGFVPGRTSGFLGNGYVPGGTSYYRGGRRGSYNNGFVPGPTSGYYGNRNRSGRSYYNNGFVPGPTTRGW